MEQELNDLSQPPDHDLVKAAVDGDAAAFHRLVDRHAKRLFRTALSLVHSRADAEDLFQETLLGAFRGLSRFDGRASVKTWMSSIMINQASKAWHRSRHTRATRSIDGDAADCDRNDASLLVGTVDDQTDRRIDFATAVQALSPQHREVIALREVQQLSYDEIAEALHVPRGTIESRIHRARLELRKILNAYASNGAGSKEIASCPSATKPV